MFSVIIPSKNADNLTACVHAVQNAQTGVRIIVVDDGAKGGSGDLDVLWVDGVKPFIFARNVNLGIAAAGDDDVVVLNDDAILQTAGGFTRLAQVGKHYGVTSSAIKGDVGNLNQLHRSSGVRLETERGLAFICVFIPRTVLNLVGPFDERFNGYGSEDTDYCQRVLNAGLQLAICDDCVVEHGSLRSTFRYGRNYRNELEIGRNQYREKWNSPAGPIGLVR